jgi:mannan polymerase II complex MNN11 subunit
LVPQRILNSYNFEIGDSQEIDRAKGEDGLFQEGDLLVHFHGCGTVPERNCEDEMRSYYENWQREVRRLNGKEADR